MPLILRAVSLNDVPLSQPISARFDAAGGTIGRVDNNTMALPDPERYISRQQAQVVATASGYVISNIGAANPILVRNQRLMHGESAPLAHRDQVRIGGYLLEAVEEPDRAGEGARPAVVPEPQATVWPMAAPHALTPSQKMPRPTASIGDLNTPLSGNNPFANLLGATPGRVPPAADASPPVPRPAFQPASQPTSQPTMQPTMPPASNARLPDDFDPFGTSPERVTPDPPDVLRGRGAFGDLIPDSAPSSLDDLFGLGRPGDRDPLRDFVDESAPSRNIVGGTHPSTDPLAMFDAPDAVRPVAAPVAQARDDVPELRSSFQPPRPRPQARAIAEQRPAASPPGDAIPDDFFGRPSVPAQAPVTPQSSADGRALWAAFCEGAGVRAERAAGLDADAMRAIGALLRAAVDGTMKLIAVRSATRHELHAQVTVIRPRDNNPLKFSPDAQSALEQLLDPPLRGFLPGPEAMTDAMNDLVGHAIGSMAGTRAALEGVLGRFAPQQLEAKLTDKSVIDSVLPMNRRAKLWSLYLQHYDAIREEAQEDFHALFGKAFLAAYEQQLDRLRREKNPSSFE